MKKYISPAVFFLLTVTLVLTGCKPRNRDNSEAEKLAIADTINTLMVKVISYSDNLNIDSVLPYISDDSSAVFITAGMHYSKEFFFPAMKNVFSGLKSQNIQIIHSQVIVPSPDAAIWIGWLKNKYITKEDKSGEEFLCETWAWQKEMQGWKVIHSHESIMKLPGAEERSLAENALYKLAAELTDRKLKPVDMPVILTNYLKKFPFIYGATLAFAPDEAGGQKHIAAPYVYRSGNEFKQVDLPVAYDYTKSEWYAEPVKGKAPTWSSPYYDEGGGGIVMVTYSIPLYDKAGSLVGVLTSDLELGQK